MPLNVFFQRNEHGNSRSVDCGIDGSSESALGGGGWLVSFDRSHKIIGA